eukprot:6838225-Prymnesium_polylepis.1
MCLTRSAGTLPQARGEPSSRAPTAHPCLHTRARAAASVDVGGLGLLPLLHARAHRLAVPLAARRVGAI